MIGLQVAGDTGDPRAVLNWPRNTLRGRQFAKTAERGTLGIRNPRSIAESKGPDMRSALKWFSDKIEALLNPIGLMLVLVIIAAFLSNREYHGDDFQNDGQNRCQYRGMDC